jgi:catechol 2,3-dioxygenase-like lactoylglutathione lyase family enzyme
MKLKKLTPNLVVSNVEASLDFYRTMLGFQPGMTVPGALPYVFGSVVLGGDAEGSVEIFFNDRNSLSENCPALGAKPVGGSLTLFIEVEGVE